MAEIDIYDYDLFQDSTAFLDKGYILSGNYALYFFMLWKVVLLYSKCIVNITHHIIHIQF